MQVYVQNMINFFLIFQGGDFPAALSHGEMIGKGRSFAPATLAHLAHDEDESVFDSAVSNLLFFLLGNNSLL